MEIAIPVLCITSEADARVFYLDWLGFTSQFEWRHDPSFPIYMGIKRGSLKLRLSEYPNDAEVGGAAYCEIHDVAALHAQLKEKRPNATPDFIDQAWGMRELMLTDPFGNKLVFGQELSTP